MRKYLREYYNRPGVKEKIRERMKEYYHRLEVKERMRKAWLLCKEGNELQKKVMPEQLLNEIRKQQERDGK